MSLFGWFWSSYAIFLLVHCCYSAVSSSFYRKTKEIAHRPIFLSFFSGYFLKKSWWRSSLMVRRFSGSFCKQEKRKSVASSEISTYEGIFISSLTIFINYSSFVILKGFYPTTISYIITPNDQISIFSSYSFPLRIYGPTYRGVPQKVVLKFLSLYTDHPKSQSFTIF